MDNGFVTIGYYICHKTDAPSYLGFDTDSFISVSDCLCDHEPQIVYCHSWKPHGDDPQYIGRYFSDREEYIKMSGEIGDLFSQNLFDTDGSFLRKKDAVYFYKKYFAAYDCTLIAVSTMERYSELSSGNFDHQEYESGEAEGEFIGCDIIGWDISGFHSFLCNSLHEEFDEISFNKYGLLDESFEKAEQMAEKIQGMGEPVDWIPVMIHKLY
ncbi:hypothetical protein [Ruminococcus sp.]